MPLYTSSQAAEITKVAGSTLRKYVKQFKPFFSDSAQKGRGRRYTRQDILLILKIKRLFSEGFNEKEVKARLDVVDDEDFMDVAQLLPDVTEPLEEAKRNTLALKNQLKDYQETTDNKMDALADRLADVLEYQKAEKEYQKAEKEYRKAEKEYRKALAKWESLGFFERRRTPKPKPPE